MYRDLNGRLSPRSRIRDRLRGACCHGRRCPEDSRSRHSRCYGNRHLPHCIHLYGRGIWKERKDGEHKELEIIKSGSLPESKMCRSVVKSARWFHFALIETCPR